MVRNALAFVALGASLAGGIAVSRGHARAPMTCDVAIIGGGPCGLATAIALSKARSLKRCTVRVFERDHLEPKGAAVALSPLAWAVLEAIDGTASARIRREGSPVEAVDMRPLHTRDASAGDAAAAAARDAKPGPPVLHALWAAWLRALGLGERVQTTFLWHDVRAHLAVRARELLGPQGVALGVDLVAIEPTRAPEHGHEGLTLRFRRLNRDAEREADELVCHARLVLACDGVQSAVRAAAPAGPRAAEILLDEEKSVWRGISPTTDVRGRATFYKDTGAGAGASASAGRMGVLLSLIHI